MCGRAACTLAPKQLKSRVCKEFHSLCDFRGESDYHPTYNLCPTESAPVARQVIEENDKEFGGIVLQNMQWGLLTNPNRPINARVEGLEDVAMFRRLLDKNRCVLYVSGFYEWDRHDDKEKKPYFVRGVRPGLSTGDVSLGVKKEEVGEVKEEVKGANVKSEIEHTDQPTQINNDERLGFNDDSSPLLPMAGFWTRTKRQGSSAHGMESEDDFAYSFSLITMPSTKSFASIHHRLPAILQSPEEVREWLDVQNKPWDAVKHLMRPAEGLVWYRVDPKVGKNSIKSADCIQPYSEDQQKSNQKTLHSFFGPSVKRSKVETEDGKVEAKSAKLEEEKQGWANIGSPMRLKGKPIEDEIASQESASGTSTSQAAKIESSSVKSEHSSQSSVKGEARDVKRVAPHSGFISAKSALTSPARAKPQKRSLQNMLSQPKLDEEETKECPVCGTNIRASTINAHVNQCLDGGM